MEGKILRWAVVQELIGNHRADLREHAKHREKRPEGAGETAINCKLDRYVEAAIRDECRLLARIPAGNGRYPQLRNSAVKLTSLLKSDWAEPFDVYGPLLEAAHTNGLVAKYGEDDLRRVIDWAFANAAPRPVPPPRRAAPSDGEDPGHVPTVEYTAYSTVGTPRDAEPVPEPPPAAVTAEGRAEIDALFPSPRDKDGHTVPPEMHELAMVRRDDPRRGATHMVISNSWRNPSNRVYRRRALFRFMRQMFREHQAGGGSIYHTRLRVGTNSEDDREICEAERREWDRLRKRLQRLGAKYRWFSIVTDEGAFREIFASEPLSVGQQPLDDPEAALLGVVRQTRPLGQPYKKRPSHGGAPEWQPPRTENGKWVTVGHRPAEALLEYDQDPYDEAAAAANGVRTWRASEAEVNAQSPEAILRTRHWLAPPTSPNDILYNLFEEVGFNMSRKAWDWAFGERTSRVGAIDRESVEADAGGT